jgi:L-fuculose-phosphate aldolase
VNTPFQTKSEMVEIARRLYQRDHIGAAEGNLSALLSDGRIMITPSGANKGYMKPEDLVICDSAGKKLQGAGRPSSEIKLHVAIYSWRPDISAICHAHPLYATGFSAARIALDRCILPEVVATLGAVPLAHYGPPGTSELPETLASMVDRYDAFLLEAHGVLTLGKSLEDAFNKIEIVERYAHILSIAEQLGEVNELSPAEIERLLKSAGRLNLKEELLSARNNRINNIEKSSVSPAPPDIPEKRASGYR